MKQSYYFFSSGTLKRKDNTLRFETEDGRKKDIPIEMVEDIFCFGEVNVNSSLLSFFAKTGVCIHYFGYYENYIGTFYPKENLLSGKVHICQARHYIDEEKRVLLAKAFIEAGSYNILRNLRYYCERGRNLDEAIEQIKDLRVSLEKAQSVNEIMGIEGNIRKTYYDCWNDIFADKADFSKRVKQPPDNIVNSLISFCNMMVYSCCISEIYNTQLDPTISFLHEPGDRRFSLSLDLAEVFKPLLSDRLIFSLVNKKQIDEKSFIKDSNGIWLKESAKRVIAEEFDKRLKQTIKHKKLGRSVSYRRLIRLDSYRIIKHVMGEESYEGFKIWW